MTRFDQLAQLLSRTPLTWSSESDFPIEPVTVPTPPTGKRIEHVGRLLYAQEANWGCAGVDLVLLLDNGSLQAIKRPTGRPSEYELYLLVREGFGFVGVRTRVVET
jgi:hypothetical protein